MGGNMELISGGTSPVPLESGDDTQEIASGLPDNERKAIELDKADDEKHGEKINSDPDPSLFIGEDGEVIDPDIDTDGDMLVDTKSGIDRSGIDWELAGDSLSDDHDFEDIGYDDYF